MRRINRHPVRHSRGGEAEGLKLTESESGQPVTTALITGEDRPVDDRDRASGLRERERSRCARRAGADHEHADAFGGRWLLRDGRGGVGHAERLRGALDGRPPLSLRCVRGRGTANI